VRGRLSWELQRKGEGGCSARGGEKGEKKEGEKKGGERKRRDWKGREKK